MKIIGKAWKKWLVVSRAIGNFQGQVIFSVFYLVFLSVLGIIFRFFADPIKIKTKKSFKKRSNLLHFTYKDQSLIDLRRQF